MKLIVKGVIYKNEQDLVYTMLEKYEQLQNTLTLYKIDKTKTRIPFKSILSIKEVQ